MAALPKGSYVVPSWVCYGFLVRDTTLEGLGKPSGEPGLGLLEAAEACLGGCYKSISGCKVKTGILKTPKNPELESLHAKS